MLAMSQKRIMYYTDARGQMPVLDFLRGVTSEERRKTSTYITYLQQRGDQLRRPIAAYLGGKLYELRPKQIRIIYAFLGQDIIVLHAFRKTTGQVPIQDIRLAQARLAELLH